MAQKIRSVEGLLRVVPDPGKHVLYDFLVHVSTCNLMILIFRLPKEGETNILITSALPYCNNVPHLGTF